MNRPDVAGQPSSSLGHRDPIEGARAPRGPSVLFCPADRPDRFAKALSRADVVILDMEDAVSPDRKSVGRAAVQAALDDLPIDRTVVRINALGTPDGNRDTDALSSSDLRYVMVPKAADPTDVERLGEFSVIGLCETARGIEAARELASVENVVGLMWGGEDLTADIGGWSSRGRDGRYLPHVNYARSHVLISAAAAGIVAWDGVYLDIEDSQGLEAECGEAVAMGFAAKVAIHPSQCPVIRDAYRPTADQRAWASRLLEAIDAAESGVISFEGRMVDGPLVAMARSIAGAPHGPDQA